MVVGPHKCLSIRSICQMENSYFRSERSCFPLDCCLSLQGLHKRLSIRWIWSIHFEKPLTTIAVSFRIAVVSPDGAFARRRFARSQSRFTRRKRRFARTKSRFARTKSRFARTNKSVFCLLNLIKHIAFLVSVVYIIVLVWICLRYAYPVVSLTSDFANNSCNKNLTVSWSTFIRNKASSYKEEFVQRSSKLSLTLD